MTRRARSTFGLTGFLALLAGIFYLASGPGGFRQPARPANADIRVEATKLSHEETLLWITEQRAWRRARKTKPIWARAVLEQEVGKGFQTADRAVEQARKGYWLCAGVAGEPWFQSLEKIEAKYEPANEEVKRFGFDDELRSYRIFKPKATVWNWAAQVKGQGIAGFFIRPDYDPTNPLYSPSGGYVVRDDVADPYEAKADDVWLVQEGLFNSTYELMP